MRKRKGEGGACAADFEGVGWRNEWPSEDVDEMDETELTELEKTAGGGVAGLALRDGVAPVFNAAVPTVAFPMGAASTSISMGGVSSL